MAPGDVGGSVHRHPGRVDPEARLNELELEAEEFEGEDLARYRSLLDRTLSAPELMAVPDPDVTQLLGPLIVRGQRIMLGAAKGQGKTSMMLQIVRATLFGEEFLGFEGIGHGRALILDAEQGIRTLKLRISEAGLEGVPRDMLAIEPVPEGLLLDTSRADRNAVETIIARGRYDIVVFDPFYMIHEGDSTKERDSVDLMKILDEWRRQYDFALFMPAHTRKPGADRYRFSMHDFFGSSALLRNADVVLGLEKKSYGQARLHLFSDRDGDLLELFKDEPWGLRFTRGHGFERGPVTDARKKRSETSLRKVEAELSRNPGSDVYQLMNRTGLGRTAVESALHRLNPQREKEGKRLRYTLPGS